QPVDFVFENFIQRRWLHGTFQLEKNVAPDGLHIMQNLLGKPDLGETHQRFFQAGAHGIVVNEVAFQQRHVKAQNFKQVSGEGDQEKIRKINQGDGDVVGLGEQGSKQSVFQKRRFAKLRAVLPKKQDVGQEKTESRR